MPPHSETVAELLYCPFRGPVRVSRRSQKPWACGCPTIRARSVLLKGDVHIDVRRVSACGKPRRIALWPRLNIVSKGNRQ